MPRVKIDYIVSFSNEDPENPASNLLAWDVSKKKWLCTKGESSCSVLLQLPRAVKINSVNIGAYQAALVEVLVGRSEAPNEPFQVLVPSSVFVSPAESRRAEGAERVRSFSGDQLSAARHDKWDRLRVVCSQPYNKHCKYGLSFIHIYEPETKDSAAPSPSPLPLAALSSRPLSMDAASSDEDEFQPGELFAKHRQGIADASGKNTDAQIRQATSQALKNISDSSTKLTRTPITKAPTKRPSPFIDYDVVDTQSNRQRDSLMYTDDDEQPHAKIDHVVNRHKDEKAKKADEEKHEDKQTKHKDKQHKRDDSKHRSKDDSSHSKHRQDESSHSRDKKDAPKTPQSKKNDRGEPSTSHSNRKEDRKRTRTEDKPAKKRAGFRAGPVTSSPHTLLKGVVFVLSGYENPRRAAVRDAALAMGARFERDWRPHCTHLICAFPNTPKLKAVRASSNGAAAVVVTAEWVEQCCERRRLLPWQWFATEPAQRVSPTDDDDDDDDDRASQRRRKQRSPSGSNTDDQSDRVPERKRQRTESPAQRQADKRDEEKTHKQPAGRSPSPQQSNVANVSSESDVAFVRDERIQGNVTITDSDSDSTNEETVLPTSEIDDSKVLPDFFEGYTFAIDDTVAEAFDEKLLSRYVRAYGGLVLEASQLDEDSSVDYWLCAHASGDSNARGKTRAVRADWVWRCHESRRLCPVAEYALT